jgi:dynein heavy chain
MNTVLDDNKKLCLNSGEILTLSPYMTMMFEVEDLLVASPATVSRCGMVYIEPQSMGLAPLVRSWVQSVPVNFREKSKTFSDALSRLFEVWLEPSIDFLRKNVKEPVQTVDNNLCQSLCRILNCYLRLYVDTELKKFTVEEITAVEQQIDSLFFYAIVWSVACTTDAAGRERFSVFLREMLAKNPLRVAFPSERTIYDFRWDLTRREWVQWGESYANFEIDSRLGYGEIMIPTNDSTRNTYNMKLLLSNLHHVLFPGPTGTGKSLNAFNLLQNDMGEEY